MSFQNPVFIPGPTNMPEALRRACDMPTLDHRSPPSRTSCSPRATACGRSCAPPPPRCSSSRHRHRRLGSRDHQHAVARRHGSRGAQRHVLPPLDRHVPAPWPDRRDRRNALGRRHPAAGSRRSCAPTRTAASRRFSPPTTKRRPACCRTSPPCAGAGCRAAPGAAVRRRRVLHRVDAVRVRRLGRGCRRHRQPEGLHAARGPCHHRLFAKALAAVETGGLPRCFYDIRDMAKSYAANGYPYTPPWAC
jgi:alanine-glyoxylate transaminase/serine-glyoxylate transaminase/serine-pyruvate transaminase